jgi:hypothetical protein
MFSEDIVSPPPPQNLLANNNFSASCKMSTSSSRLPSTETSSPNIENLFIEIKYIKVLNIHYGALKYAVKYSSLFCDPTENRSLQLQYTFAIFSKLKFLKNIAKLFDSHEEFMYKVIQVAGWAKTTRMGGKDFCFIEVSDGSSLKGLQVKYKIAKHFRL